MIDAILSLFNTFFCAIFPHWAENHGKKSETRMQYDCLRQEIAAALTMYSCCFHNPVDIARIPDHKLPDDYEEGSKKLRELGSRLGALAETMPPKVKDMPISQKQMLDVRGNLIGLSNSFRTPYNVPYGHENRDYVSIRVSEIRKTLDIS